MRWPIQSQLLLPMLTVVVLAIVLASLGSAYYGGVRARQSQEESLHRVVTTLTEARFPLSEPVLRQMGGLSGGEFVLLDRHDALQASTLSLDADDLEQLRRIHDDEPSSDLAGRPTISLGGRNYLSQRVAVAGRDPVSPAGALVVLYPEDRWSATMRQAAYPALTAGAVALIAAMLVTTVLAHRFVQPIRELGDRAAAIARGDFKAVPIARHDDEIRDLAVSLNQMAEQLGQYEVQVRRHEQIRTLDRLGAGMAHQLRNAATGARIAIELHQLECKSDSTHESLDVALRQLSLMESYLKRFMAAGREASFVNEDVLLAKVIEDAMSLVRPTCIHAGIDLEVSLPQEQLTVRGDPEDLRQLLVNLVVNAVEAAERRSGVQPRIMVTLQKAKDGYAALQVRDNGPGPTPQVAQSLFEPFVTGKSEGTGLGLYVARQVAERHHGVIRWQREEGTTCFVVELPLVGGVSG